MQSLGELLRKAEDPEIEALKQVYIEETKEFFPYYSPDMLAESLPFNYRKRLQSLESRLHTLIRERRGSEEAMEATNQIHDLGDEVQKIKAKDTAFAFFLYFNRILKDTAELNEEVKRARREKIQDLKEKLQSPSEIVRELEPYARSYEKWENTPAILKKPFQYILRKLYGSKFEEFERAKTEEERLAQSIVEQEMVLREINKKYDHLIFSSLCFSHDLIPIIANGQNKELPGKELKKALWDYSGRTIDTTRSPQELLKMKVQWNSIVHSDDTKEKMKLIENYMDSLTEETERYSPFLLGEWIEVNYRINGLIDIGKLEDYRCKIERRLNEIIKAPIEPAQKCKALHALDHSIKDIAELVKNARIEKVAYYCSEPVVYTFRRFYSEFSQRALRLLGEAHLENKYSSAFKRNPFN